MTLRVHTWKFVPLAAVLLCAAVSCSAQGKAAARPTFDVASIRVNTNMKDRRGMSATSTGIQYLGVTLRACIATAYDVKEFQVTGPSWLQSDLYDINAKTDDPVTTEQIHLMLQSLLADRFKVTFHREQKELPVLALVVGKHGTKLQPASADAAATGGPGGGVRFDFKAGTMMFEKTSLQSFAEYLSKFPAVGRPVVDHTELKGLYDFSLQLVDDPSKSTPADMKRALGDWSAGSAILSQVETIGLKLEPSKAAVEVLVVDHAEKVPTEN
jgi:uncharacterized protein (TIGR03435 family)